MSSPRAGALASKKFMTPWACPKKVLTSQRQSRLARRTTISNIRLSLSIPPVTVTVKTKTSQRGQKSAAAASSGTQGKRSSTSDPSATKTIGWKEFKIMTAFTTVGSVAIDGTIRKELMIFTNATQEDQIMRRGNTTKKLKVRSGKRSRSIGRQAGTCVTATTPNPTCLLAITRSGVVSASSRKHLPN